MIVCKDQWNEQIKKAQKYKQTILEWKGEQNWRYSKDLETNKEYNVRFYDANLKT